MSSRFVEKRITTSGKGGAFQASEKPLLAWFQFVPALVIDVITNEFHRLYNSDRDLNSVIVKVHVEDAFGKHIQTDSLSTEIQVLLVNLFYLKIIVYHLRKT